MSAAAVQPVEVAEPDVMGALLTGVERYLRSEVDAAQIDREGAVPARVLAGLGELGVFGVTIPQRYGGAGLRLTDACRLAAALARADRSIATTVGLHLGLGTRPLVAFGAEGLKQRYLPRLASGEAIAAFATTEANAGSDLSRLATTALAEGAQLVVNGEKLFVTNGRLAKVFTITAATPGLGGAQRGSSLVLLESGDPGLSVGREERKLGLKGSSTAPLTIDGVRIEPERIIGEPGRGADQLHHVLAWGRTLMSAGCCGTARAALVKAIEHTASRRQFGRTLDAQPVVREHLALMGARLAAMEALVHDTASLEDDVPGLLQRSLAAKVFGSDGASYVVDTALQLFGGLGFIEESGMPLLLRDVRITRIFEGANDVLLTQLGTHLATAPPPRRALAPLVGPDAFALACSADVVAAALDAHREELSARHKIGLLRQTRLLNRLGRAVAWSEALDATVRAVDARRTTSRGAAALFSEVAARDVANALAAPFGEEVVSSALADLEPGA
ncbi:MAG: acyl-CoA dehydrogenase family protein [Archangiaceae bacterium]|nr:acyl-CoA dehydrogenase family protein [Archangiaceae bacterium]